MADEFPPTTSDQDDQRATMNCGRQIHASLETVSHLILQTKWLPVSTLFLRSAFQCHDRSYSPSARRPDAAPTDHRWVDRRDHHH